MSPPPRSKPANSHDVAALAGVSRSTVSNILNGNDARFPEATRQRVREAARDLNYRPSIAGRSLVTGRSETVVVLLPNATFGSNLQDTVDAAVAETVPLGGNVVVRFGSEQPEATYAAISALSPLAILAFSALSPEARERLEAAGTIVVPGRTGPVSDQAMLDGGIGWIQADLVLNGSGRRALWYAGLDDRRQDVYGPGRVASLERYCAARGLPPLQTVTVPLQLDGAIRALDHLLAGDDPVGVVCYNDDVAIALLSAAKARGVRVPEEMSVVGVDNSPLGQLWQPRLTTVDPDLLGLVSLYAEELKERLAGAPPWNREPVHHFRVVRGETTPQ